jgi:hypothetical protein
VLPQSPTLENALGLLPNSSPSWYISRIRLEGWGNMGRSCHSSGESIGEAVGKGLGGTIEAMGEENGVAVVTAGFTSGDEITINAVAVGASIGEAVGACTGSATITGIGRTPLHPEETNTARMTNRLITGLITFRLYPIMAGEKLCG